MTITYWLASIWSRLSGSLNEYEAPYFNRDRQCGCGKGAPHHRVVHSTGAVPCPRCDSPAGTLCIGVGRLEDGAPDCHDERYDIHEAAWLLWRPTRWPRQPVTG